MTAPGGRQGSAYISFHAQTDRLEPELEAALRKAADDADDFLDGTGKRWGDTVSDSMSAEIERHGPDFAHSVERGVKSQVVSLGGVRFKLDERGMLHDFDSGRFVGRIFDEITDAFEAGSRPGGPLSKIGEGLSDAIGAGFNVSGKSPLIAVLIPLFGTIAALIAAALQAANALVAVLTTLPALLVAIGLQAGIVMLAFNGIGEAAKGAFAAKNATELYEAIKNLTPSAQNFVKSLLPIRDLFKQIQRMAQEGFFSAFGDTLTQVSGALGPILTSPNFWKLTQAMGTMFREIGLFFASPTFTKFLNELIPATVRWLASFGPGFVQTMDAIFTMATAAIPFLERVGMVVGNAFATFSKWITEQTKSGALVNWLDRMGTTLDKVVELFFQATAFVASFLDSLDKAGGNDVIDQFSELFAQLGAFFQSEAGQAAMQGFIHLVELLTYSFSGLIFALLSGFIAFEAILQFLNFLGASVQAFVEWLTGPAADAIAKFFTEDFPGWLQGLVDTVTGWITGLGTIFQQGWDNIVYSAQTAWGLFTEWLGERVDDVTDFFTGLPDRLSQIGQDIMNGLWSGLKWGWDHTVGPLLTWITNQIPDWKGPEAKDLKLLQPAGKAVMEGFGKGLKDGALQVQSMLTGLTDSIQFRGAATANNTFNSNLNFFGQQPSQSEARTAGRAVSEELNSQVAARDVQLAVRML